MNYVCVAYAVFCYELYEFDGDDIVDLLLVTHTSCLLIICRLCRVIDELRVRILIEKYFKELILLKAIQLI